MNRPPRLGSMMFAMSAVIAMPTMADEPETRARDTCSVLGYVVGDFSMPRPAEDVRKRGLGTGLGYYCAFDYFQDGGTECFVSGGVTGARGDPGRWRVTYRWKYEREADASRTKELMERAIERCGSLVIDTDSTNKGDTSSYYAFTKRRTSTTASVMIDVADVGRRGYLTIMTISGDGN